MGYLQPVEDLPGSDAGKYHRPAGTAELYNAVGDADTLHLVAGLLGAILGAARYRRRSSVAGPRSDGAPRCDSNQRSKQREVTVTNVVREVDTSKKDEQVRHILDDPDTYFSQAWETAFEQAKQRRATSRPPRSRIRAAQA